MCGRFSLTSPVEAMSRLFGFSELPNLAPRYNIAPSQDIAVVRSSPEGGGRELAMLRWGLIPSWAKERDFGARTINARAETVAEKPSFRAAYKKRRCLVPADGYYEWKKASDGKQPYRFCRQDDGLFAFAGLWEHWRDPADGEELQTCTIIVCEAGAFTQPVHHRMPVIVQPDLFPLWLGEEATGSEDAAAVLRAANDDGMKAYAVSRRVNSARNDDTGCVEALTEPEVNNGDEECGEEESGAANGGTPPKQGSLF